MSELIKLVNKLDKSKADVFMNQDFPYSDGRRSTKTFEKDDKGNFILDENNKKVGVILTEAKYTTDFTTIKSGKDKGKLKANDNATWIDSKHIVSLVFNSKVHSQVSGLKDVIDRVTRWDTTEWDDDDKKALVNQLKIINGKAAAYRIFITVKEVRKMMENMSKNGAIQFERTDDGAAYDLELAYDQVKKEMDAGFAALMRKKAKTEVIPALF